MNGTPLDSFLDPGEQLRWSGQPKPGLRLQASDALMIPFSIMWGGFAIFWEAGVLGLTSMGNPHHQAAPVFMALWGIPFVMVGLYMMVGRFFYDAALRKKTWYGVTNQRVIILKTLFGSSVNSFDYAHLTNLNLVERGDRSGDILFGLPMSTVQWGSGRNRTAPVPGFYLLPDARRIFSQIRGAQEQDKK